jgi:hypothetical protein
MPGSIYDWSKTAGQNDTADPDIDWREGMFPDAVNDSSRQMMGRNAEFRDDITGSLAAAGTSNAITLTANSAFTSLANGRLLTFRAAANNTAAVTLNVNSLGSKAIRAIGTAGDVDLAPNDLKAGCVYTVIYSATANGNSGAWILFAPFSKFIEGCRIDAFPAGTRLLFQQSAAPTGWTKDTTHDNKALRVVNGTATTGGSVSFTTAFSSTRLTTSVAQGGTVGGTVITVAQMPAHIHGPGNLSGGTGLAGNHSHGPGNLSGGTNTAGSHSHPRLGNGYLFNGSGSFTSTVSGNNVTIGDVPAAGDHAHSVYVNGGVTSAAGDHTHPVYVNSGATAAAGSDQAHTHTFTGEAHSHTTDLAVQYVDVIICEKAG